MNDYQNKFREAIQNTVYEKLDEIEKTTIQELSYQYRFTFQEIRKVVEQARDLSMWKEGSFQEWWNSNIAGKQFPKKEALKLFDKHFQLLRSKKNSYPIEGLPTPVERKGKKIVLENSDKKIYGLCPVASEDTVCCNLQTIDAVKNCVFGCSYCTIQSFYENTFEVDANLSQKLKEIPIDVNTRYHFSTGQSSDSLVWGNKYGILDELIAFAKRNTNIILEFKTKSKNVSHFLKNEIPPNIICTWSLNTETIAQNEEHFTAHINERLEAARKVADKGIKIGFHFHPIVYYDHWEREYSELAAKVRSLFSPQEIVFISLGTLTFIKPVLKKIRDLGFYSKILQMEFAKDPKGKLTYPDSIKIELFNHLLTQFSDWEKEIFFYLCMEKREIWKQTIGDKYQTNQDFEKSILDACFRKIRIQKEND